MNELLNRIFNGVKILNEKLDKLLSREQSPEIADQSQEINELSAAMAKAQGEMHAATKNGKGYNYTYASLGSMMEATRPALEKHGLSVIQTHIYTGKEIILRTVLTHSSGQFMASRIPLIPENGAKGGPNQALGSSNTYMRRYAYESIVGVPRADDELEKKYGR